MNWKDELIRYKWISTQYLLKKYAIKKYDIDNFTRKPEVKKIIHGWRLQLGLQPDRLKAILAEAWEYFLIDEIGMRPLVERLDWVPSILSLSGITRGEKTGFGFLVDSRYLQNAFGATYKRFASRGYTNIAFGLFHCFPGREFLHQHGIMPFMFHQTHRNVLKHVDILSMIEHVYIWFWDYHTNPETHVYSPNPVATNILKQRLIARAKEKDFLNSHFFRKYGVPYNFYKDEGLANLLEQLAQKYSLELGLISDSRKNWNANIFLREHPENLYDKCKYCSLSPVDLHHLVSRQKYPEHMYNVENVIPLCLQVHGCITRKKISNSLSEKYNKCISKWLRRRNANVFYDVMNLIHNEIYY